MNPPAQARDDALQRGFVLDDRRVDPGRLQIEGPDGPVRVEPRAMAVLVALARRACETVHRDALIAEVWGHPHVSDEALSRCISLLRRALGDDRAQPRYIETIPKHGYRLMVPAQQPHPPHAPHTPLMPHVPDPPGAPAQPATIVVLPFVNLSGDAADEYVADGVTELLIANLASTEGLRVISRTTAMRYKGSTARLVDIARELGVTHAVEGSVLRSGQRLQVVLQLIDAASDIHILAKTFTRQLTDLLRLQNEIAAQIADHIGTALAPAQRRTSVPPPAMAVEALEAYLRGRHFWAQRTADGFEKALREFRACIEIEPDFAAAHAGCADTLVIMALYGHAQRGALRDEADRYARRALALAPDSAEARCAAGGVALFFDWRLQAAAGLFRSALAVDASHDVARLGLADTMIFRGDFDAGLRELDAALRCNPLDLGLQMNGGEFLGWARRHDEAVQRLRRCLDLGPHFWPARHRLAEILAQAGDAAAAHEQIALAVAPSPPAKLMAARATVHAFLGERSAALALVEGLEQAASESLVSAADLGRLHALLGQADRAFGWIDIGIAQGLPRMLTLAVDPAYDPLRNDARMASRLLAVGVGPAITVSANRSAPG